MRALASLLCALGYALAVPVARAQVGAAIPPLHGTTFSGGTVTLPDALRGKAGVLILGFSEASRIDTAAWGKRVADDPHRPAGLLYFELPMLQGVPHVLRGWVLKQIRKGIPPAGQPHFLPVEDHEAEWKQAAGFTRPDAAYVLVVDGSGVVRKLFTGPVTDAAFAAVKQQAAAILAAR